MPQGGTAKLADVGLSRLQTGTYLSDVPLIGTFAWIAPEVLVGSQQCSSAVDIFRCACGRGRGGVGLCQTA